MMRSYQGPKHVAVARYFQNGESQIIGAGPNETKAPWEDLIFEIGSVTKVFTAILLCVLVEDGKVDPRAPLRQMSAELSAVPDRITPESLATHTSGLPRLHIPIWKALMKPLGEDPYADFTRSDLLAWLDSRSWKAPRARRHAYSNFGVGLLGEAMAMTEGKPFCELLNEKVIGPLGLKDTTAELDKNQSERFLQPRNTKGTAVVPWTFRAMSAAGCLRSKANDLGRFATQVLQALEAPETVLDRALRRSVSPLFGLGPKGSLEPSAQCFGWQSIRIENGGPRILYHDGATAGSTSALYVCPEKSASLVVLSNNGAGADLLASAKLSWSNQIRQAHGLFTSL
ncbi:MAG: beta-lactamase family protein [Boseongicola sp.]|nr:beta-lactamase family protein [Boseongicola sp.]